jgi:hypothetical protein
MHHKLHLKYLSRHTHSSNTQGKDGKVGTTRDSAIKYPGVTTRARRHRK